MPLCVECFLPLTSQVYTAKKGSAIVRVRVRGATIESLYVLLVVSYISTITPPHFIWYPIAVCTSGPDHCVYKWVSVYRTVFRVDHWVLTKRSFSTVSGECSSSATAVTCVNHCVLSNRVSNLCESVSWCCTRHTFFFTLSVSRLPPPCVGHVEKCMTRGGGAVIPRHLRYHTVVGYCNCTALCLSVRMRVCEYTNCRLVL